MKRVFVSYSHRDEAFRAELDKHLSLLKRQGVLDLWMDRRIPAGGDIHAAISESLEAADVVLLLVSIDFINSDYCYSVEMTRALQRHAAGECIVVPVILRPCDWHTAPFAGLKALPTEGKEVTRWANQDEAFADIARNLRQLLAAPQPMAQPGAAFGHALAPPPAGASRSANLALPRTFSDQEKHDFTAGTLGYIRDYFSASLTELQDRNDHVTFRMTERPPQGFTTVLFRQGNRLGGCYIRVGGGFSTDNLAYSSEERGSTNSYNEMLMLGADDQKLYWSASMAIFHDGDRTAKLSQQGAAEHFWTMLIEPLQRRSG